MTRCKALDTRFKTDETDGLAEGEFIAYPSTFVRKADAYGDVVAKGAFIDSIKQWKDSGNVMPVLYGHRMDDPDYNIGGVTDMGEDDHGWWIRGSFDMDSPKAAQVYRLVKEHRLTQLSFAFDVLDEGEVKLDDGTVANELRKLQVYEASFVPVGANQDTGVAAIKSAEDPSAHMDFSQNTRSADETTNEGSKTGDGDADKREEPDAAKREDRKAKAKALDLAISIALKGQKGE